MGYREDLLVSYPESAIKAYERCFGNEADDEDLSKFEAMYLGTYPNNNDFAVAHGTTAGPLELYPGTEINGWVCTIIATDEIGTAYWKSGTYYFKSV